MDDLGQWLEQIGLSEYAELFAEQRIGRDVLRELTEQDLKDFGLRSATASDCFGRSLLSMSPLMKRPLRPRRPKSSPSTRPARRNDAI